MISELRLAAFMYDSEIGCYGNCPFWTNKNNRFETINCQSKNHANIPIILKLANQLYIALNGSNILSKILHIMLKIPTL